MLFTTKYTIILLQIKEHKCIYLIEVVETTAIKHNTVVSMIELTLK